MPICAQIVLNLMNIKVSIFVNFSDYDLFLIILDWKRRGRAGIDSPPSALTLSESNLVIKHKLFSDHYKDCLYHVVYNYVFAITRSSYRIEKEAITQVPKPYIKKVCMN